MVCSLSSFKRCVCMNFDSYIIFLGIGLNQKKCKTGTCSTGSVKSKIHFCHVLAGNSAVISGLMIIMI